MSSFRLAAGMVCLFAAILFDSISRIISVISDGVFIGIALFVLWPILVEGVKHHKLKDQKKD